MTRPRRKPGRSLLSNALLMGIGFALLGHALWKNQGQIQDVFRRSLDGRWLAIAFVLVRDEFKGKAIVSALIGYWTGLFIQRRGVNYRTVFLLAMTGLAVALIGQAPGAPST